MKFIVDTNENQKSMIESKRNLRKDYIKLLKSVENPEKNSFNPFTKSKYADLSSVLKVIKEAQKDTDLAFFQDVSTDGDLINCTSIFMGIDGEIVSDTLSMPVSKKDPQSYASIETYARRYSAQSFVGIVAESDTDGNQQNNYQSRSTRQSYHGNDYRQNNYRSNNYNQNYPTKNSSNNNTQNSDLATNQQFKIMQTVAKKLSDVQGGNASQLGKQAMKDVKVNDPRHMKHDEANQVINLLTKELEQQNSKKESKGDK